MSLTFEKMASQREKVDADFSVRQRNTTRASKGRDLHLDDGEALFRVAKNLAHPFRVHTPQATIEAKRTQFNIDVINDTTVVTLLEGHVLVISWQSGVLLNPSEQIAIARSGAPSKPWPVDVKSVTAWTEHRLVFEDVRLAEVIAEFNRYSPQPFVIEDPALGAVRITATFDTASTQSFADALEAAGSLRITHRARGDNLINQR